MGPAAGPSGPVARDERGKEHDVVFVAAGAEGDLPAAGDEAQLRGAGVAVDLEGREVVLRERGHPVDPEDGDGRIRTGDVDGVALVQGAELEEHPGAVLGGVDVPEEQGRAELARGGRAGVPARLRVLAEWR